VVSADSIARHTSSAIAATSGAVPIGDLTVAAGVSSTHLAQRFKELIGPGHVMDGWPLPAD
jgi:hypothetical protein